ncbi:MAG TPA: ParA family protein [Chloroflexota bacterium]|nr:ParA family protein [Chloroflexota bacterium]
MASIIAISNQKGGVGKTTTTANLGSALFMMGRRVLLVDMDPQANLTTSFGLSAEPETSIADSLLDRKVRLPICSIAENLEARLDIVPSSLALASAEAALMNKLGRELRLRDQLALFSSAYDFIVIDTPPSLGLLTINALVAADKVVIPTEARLFSLQGLQMMQDSIEEILYLNPRLQVAGILLSKLDKRLKEEKLVSAYLRDRWGTQVFETEVGTNSKILEAASSGTSVFNYAGAEKAADGYLALAREVLSRG